MNQYRRKSPRLLLTSARFPVPRWLAAVALVALLGACGEDAALAVDGGSDSAAPARDSGSDVDGALDSSIPDSAPDDAAPADAALPDAAPDAPVDFTPYFHDGFESYAPGEKPPSGFSRTTASADQAFRGSQSARMAIEPGDNGGFGRWGGQISIRPVVEKAGEVWVRLYVYWPSSMEFSASPFMKFLRLHNQDGMGDNDGYNDLYVDNANGPTGVLRCIKEVHDIWELDDGPPLPRDTWERYEMYLFVDDVPVDEGGRARFRIWRGDELVFDRTDVPTIETADGAIDLFYLFSYWNNEMPPSNHVYVDDLTLTTGANPPPNRDAAGNAIIGEWGG